MSIWKNDERGVIARIRIPTEGFDIDTLGLIHDLVDMLDYPNVTVHTVNGWLELLSSDNTTGPIRVGRS